jgi:hypothetical protein
MTMHIPGSIDNRPLFWKHLTFIEEPLHADIMVAWHKTQGDEGPEMIDKFGDLPILLSRSKRNFMLQITEKDEKVRISLPDARLYPFSPLLRPASEMETVPVKV